MDSMGISNRNFCQKRECKVMTKEMTDTEWVVTKHQGGQSLTRKRKLFSQRQSKRVLVTDVPEDTRRSNCLASKWLTNKV